MSDFFSDGPASDCLYKFYRDEPEQRHVRDRIEAMWNQVSGFCGDRHFLSEARTQFHQRTWELTMASLLHEQGFKLSHADGDGPDIKVEVESRTCWFEAVAPTAGNGLDAARSELDAVNELEVCGTIAILEGNHDSRLLRYTQVLDAKWEQHAKFLSRGRVRNEDPYVVAINAGLIALAGSENSDYPDIVRAVFPIDEPLYDGTGAVTHPYRDTIVRVSGAPVPTNAFATPELAAVSAVVFCPDGVWALSDLRGDSLITVHNPNAAAPLRRGTLQCGREYWVENGRIESRDWRSTEDEEITASLNRVYGDDPAVLDGALSTLPARVADLE
jgi:hypothetical protein